MLINYDKIDKENSKKAVIRCIELMGLKNPGNIESVDDETYSHTNSRGRKRFFKIAYDWNKYNCQNWSKVKHKLHKVNGFYIAEFDVI